MVDIVNIYIDTTGKLAWNEWKEDTPSLISVE